MQVFQPMKCESWWLLALSFVFSFSFSCTVLSGKKATAFVAASVT